MTVEDLVASGRYPHQRWNRQWSRAGEAAVNQALDSTATNDLRHRPAEQISGAQRQRAFLAMTLARESPLMLLDELRTFLDIAQQVEVLCLVKDVEPEEETFLSLFECLCRSLILAVMGSQSVHDGREIAILGATR